MGDFYKRLKRYCKKHLPNKVVVILMAINKRRHSKKEYDFYENINVDMANPAQERALIVLIPDFLHDKDINHGAKIEFIEIIYCIINRGYTVDLMDVRDYKQLEKIRKENRNYDLVLGLQSPLMWHVLDLQKNARKIIYTNGSSTESCVENERKRFAYLYERHPHLHKKIHPRVNNDDTDRCLGLADYLIVLGNKITVETYSKFIPVEKIYMINSIPLNNQNFIPHRNIMNTKKKFLWFGSMGVILKGLDLVIDVFNELEEYELYVYGVLLNEKEFVQKMVKSPNIHIENIIDVQSQEFINLMNSVSYMIFPSASEGMSGSVLTCMKHGVIPIITEETGVDLPPGMGMYMPSIQVADIKEVIYKCASLEDEKVSRMHEMIFSYYKDKFTIKDYRDSMMQILKDIV